MPINFKLALNNVDMPNIKVNDEKRKSKAKLKSKLHNGILYKLKVYLEPVINKNMTQETRYSSIRSSSITPYSKKVQPQVRNKPNLIRRPSIMSLIIII